MSTVNLADWEGSKENVQPLRGGRDPHMLSEAFREGPSAQQAARLKAQREAFEEAISNDTSADPLAIWIKYIMWVQQSFPNGTQELIPVVERCADLFKANALYKNDQRYIKVWIHYAHLVKEPLDIFAMLEQRDIGIMVAHYYDAKARFLEARKRYKDAAETYELGLRRSAHPPAFLIGRQQDFLARWNKKIAEEGEEEVVNDENAENRQVLGTLKANKKGEVPVVRPTVKGNGLPDVTKKRKLDLASSLGNGKNTPFEVFSDENDDGKKSAIPQRGAATGNWSVLGAEATKYKENTATATKWTGQKIPQKKARSAPPAGPSFSVYVDPEEEDQPAPAKPQEEPKLRARLDNPPKSQNAGKPALPIDPHKSETGDLTGYNRALIFDADGTEYSFEEIRAAKYAYIESIEDKVEKMSIKSPPASETRSASSPDPVAPVIPLAPLLVPTPAEPPRQALAPKRTVLGPKTVETPIPAPQPTIPVAPLVPVPAAVKPTGMLPPLGASALTTSSIPVVAPPQQHIVSTPLTRHHNSHMPSATKDSGSKNLDASFTFNSSFTFSGPLVSLTSPTINTRQAMAFADDLMGMGPSLVPQKVQHKQPAPEEDDEDFDPNQENAPPNDENNFRQRLTNRDIIAATLGNNNNAMGTKVTNQHFISNQFNASNLDVTSELVDTEDIARCVSGAPKIGSLDFEIFEDATLDKVTPEEPAPARALREIPPKPVMAASKPLASKSVSYNTTPNQSFNDSFSDPLNLRRPIVRKIDTDFLDPNNSLTSFTSIPPPILPTTNNNNNIKPAAKTDFVIFEEEDIPAAKPASTYNTPHSTTSNTTFNVSHSSLSLSNTTASSMFTPASKNSVYSALTPLTPLGGDSDGAILPYEVDPLLERMYAHLQSLPNFCEVSENAPQCAAFAFQKRTMKAIEMEHEERQLHLDGLSVVINKCCGQGGFATVYNVERTDQACTSNLDTDFSGALKMQVPSSIWEFYMGSQIEHRIPKSLKRNFMSFHSLHLYLDRSFLLMDMGTMGSLHDTINSYKLNVQKEKQVMPECLAIYYTIEMLKIVETLHENGIIHGDIKADNFLMREKDPSEMTDSDFGTSGLQLIDFGHSIDLSLYPSGAVFTGAGTAAYKCTEMETGQPWTYHIDTYGLCFIVHCMLFGSYMEVAEQNVAGVNKFRPKLQIPRYKQVALWTQFFDQLLNLPACHPRPSLTPLRQTFENYLRANPKVAKDISKELTTRKFNAFSYLKTMV